MSSSLIRPHLSAAIEPLESRIAPATFQWITDGGGSWTDSVNWALVSGTSTLGYPDAPGDEARIGKTSFGEAVIAVPAGAMISLAALSLFNDRSFIIGSVDGGRLSFEGSFPRIDVEGKGAHQLLAPLTIANHFYIEHRGVAELSINGQITESVVNTEVTKYGSGTLRLSAPLTGQRYTGTTEVFDGDVILDGAAPNTIPGNLHIGGSALWSPRVLLTESNLIRDFSNVQVFSSGSLVSTEPALVERVGNLTVQGSVDMDDGTLEASRIRLEGGTLEAGTLRLTGRIIEGWGALAAPLTLTLPTEVRGTLPGTPLTLNEIAGPAQLITITQGTVRIGTIQSLSEIHIASGVLELTGALNASVRLVGGTLTGVGSLAGTIAGTEGTLAPGLPIGRVTSAGITLSESLTLPVDLTGTSAGEFDQLVAPAVDLGDAKLTVNLGANASVGDVFRIIDNTGSEPSGEFRNLHEGAVFVGGGSFLQITYQGGDGNDVELSVLPSAPAIHFVNDRAATFTEADGDLVTVRISKGKLTAGHFVLAPVAGLPGRANLWELDLSSHPQFTGAAVTVTARRQDLNDDGVLEGNGFANIGYLDATGNRLASVLVRGDLARFAADRIGTVTVQSMGEHAGLTQNYEADFRSLVKRIGTLLIQGNLNGSSIVAEGIGQVTVRGSLLGNANAGSGRIEAHGSLGSAIVRGSFVGVGNDSAILFAGGVVGPIDIGGSLIGSTVVADSPQADASIHIGEGSRTISIVVRGNLIAGVNGNSAQISSEAAIPRVFVGGSMVGGGIFATGNLGSVQVRGDVLAPQTGIFDGGFIESHGRIGSLVIGGSVHANAGGGLSAQSFGIISIRGDLAGAADSPVAVEVRGDTGAPQLSFPALALGSLTVGGQVRHATIHVGAFSADLQIGTVTVGGDWIASSLSVGVFSTNAFYGDADDYLGLDIKTGVLARVASITIGGQVIGTARADDSFAFTAQEFGIVTVAGVTLPLKPRAGAPDDLILSGTSDVRLRELR